MKRVRLGKNSSKLINKSNINKNPNELDDPFLDLVYSTIPMALPDFHKKFQKIITKKTLNYIRIETLTKTLSVKLAYLQDKLCYLIRLDYAYDPLICGVVDNILRYRESKPKLYKNSTRFSSRNIYFNESVDELTALSEFDKILGMLLSKVTELRSNGYQL